MLAVLEFMHRSVGAGLRSSSSRLSRVFRSSNYSRSSNSANDAYSGPQSLQNWVAVKELRLSYNIGETLLFTIYIYRLW